MIKSLIKKIENLNISFGLLILTVFGIIFIRNFLENFSSPSINNQIYSFSTFFLHYPLFYLTLILSVIIILYLFTKEKIDKISKICLMFLPIIWIPPIIDLFITAGQGWRMAYIFQDLNGLINDLFTFFGAFIMPGISPGIRIEIILVLLAIIIYIFTKTQSTLKSLFGTFVSYLMIFIFVSFPSWIVLINKLFTKQDLDYTWEGINEFFSQNNFTFLNNLHFSPNFDTFFDLSISQVYFILLFILLAVWLFLFSKNKLKAVAKNIRPYRVVHYYLMVFLGIIIAVSLNNRFTFNFFNVFSLITLLITILSSWLLAVGVNDIVDLEIDKISNPDRPLVKENLNLNDYKNLNIIFLLLSIIGSLILGYSILILILIFNIVYFIYSSPPLKLKRIPILSPFLISINCLSCALAGFFLIMPSPALHDFPKNIALLIIIIFTLGVNMKDLKDFHGDKAQNIKTLPVLLGLKKGKFVIALMTSLAIILVPILSKESILYLTSIPFAIIIFFVINKKQFQERNVFIVYFLYFILSFILLYINQ